MANDIWRCAHNPACFIIGARCEKPDIFDFSYQIEVLTEGATCMDEVRVVCAQVAATVYEDGFREGKIQMLCSRDEDYQQGAAAAFGLMGMAIAIGKIYRIIACPSCGNASNAWVGRKCFDCVYRT